MICLVVRRRVNGVAIPPKQLSKVEPLRADVHIHESLSDLFGRYVTEAWVFNSAPGPDIIPRLYDAKVTGMAQGGMNISGIEEVGGVLYTQSWWCRFV